MKKDVAWPYIFYNIITWPTYKLYYLIEDWHEWLWGWAHYKWGNGPRI